MTPSGGSKGDRGRETSVDRLQMFRKPDTKQGNSILRTEKKKITLEVKDAEYELKRGGNRRGGP
ncbi:hypothetical protein BaRGS_00028453, partial [Batillaria attramentaria]